MSIVQAIRIMSYDSMLSQTAALLRGRVLCPGLMRGVELGEGAVMVKGKRWYGEHKGFNSRSRTFYSNGRAMRIETVSMSRGRESA